MAKTDKVTATVAEGRSVDLDGQVYGPGKKIVLSAMEAVSLRASGFLVDDGNGAAVDDAAVAKGAKAGDTAKAVKKEIAASANGGGDADAGPGATTSESDGDADPSTAPA